MTEEQQKTLARLMQEHAKYLIDKYVEHDMEEDAVSIDDAVDYAKIAQGMFYDRFDESLDRWNDLDTDPREDFLGQIENDHPELYQILCDL